MFLHRQVVTAEAARRVAQGKERGIDAVKPVTLDALCLDKVKGEKPTDEEVAPTLKWIQSKLEDAPLDKIQSATEKEWTTVLMPADDFDFVGDKNELCGPLQTEGGYFFEWEEGYLRLYTRVLGHKVLQDQIISP